MIGELPRSLIVGGRECVINADFRIALNLFVQLDRDDLTTLDKAYLTVKTIYANDIPDEDFEEAVTMAYWFLDGGDMPKSEPSKIRLIDWEHDEHMIMPAVSKAAGCGDVRALTFLHWWSFLDYMGEIGEGLYSTVMSIRQKRANGKKLEKYEREFLRKHKELVVIRTEEEKRDIEELEEFLKTIT